MEFSQRRYDLIAVVFFFLMAMILEYREAFSLLEDETLSYRQILRTHFGDDALTRPAEDVLIVYTDEEFYRDYEKFPLRRVDLSTIVLRLEAMGAKVIAIDMLLDFNSAYGEDPTLEDAFAQTDNVLLVSQAEIEGDDYVGLNTAISRFHDQTENGYSNISPNSAISERIVRLRIHEGMHDRFGVWPFAVQAVSMFLGVEPVLEDGHLRIGDDIDVKLDQFSEMYIDYPLLPGAGDRTVRLHDVIGLSGLDLLFVDDEEDLEDLSWLVDGKIVLIGEVAEVAHDDFETPVGNVFGVEVIANSISTILNGGPLRPASLVTETVIGLLLMCVFLLTRLIQNPLPRNLISVSVMLLHILLVTIAYISFGTVISLSYLMLASVLSLIVMNARFYITEMGQKTVIRQMFGHYLSPKVVEDLVDNPDSVKLGGEERELTAYFSDIAGFSTISENMSPTELVALLNDYLTEMCNIILKYEGTIDKFEGDAIIAFWGAPIVQADHARLACFASIDMNERLQEMRADWAANNIPELKVRMGLNTGPMVVGNMGSMQRMNYTIMGDAVNLAARLEGANKMYGSSMMISQHTYRDCGDALDVRELDTIRVVGKSEPVTVYELLARKNQSKPVIADLAEQFEKGLKLYKQREFGSARLAFQACLEIVPGDGPALTYVDRCEEFMGNPPLPDWDGVYTHTEKG